MKHPFRIVVKGLLITVIVLSLSACGSSQNNSRDTSSSAVKTISAQEAYASMTDGSPVVVLDVGTTEDYATAHIAGALLVPADTLKEALPAILPVPDTEILIYSRTGKNNSEAEKALESLGYINVSDFGDIENWPYATASGAWQEPEKHGTLSSFTACDINGIPVDETVFKDCKLTMINVWATFCGPCIHEMPDLAEISSAYSGKGFQIIGIVSDLSPENDGRFSLSQLNDAREILQQTGVNYRCLLPSDDLVSALLNSVSAVPETIFVDSQGNVIGDSYIGSRSKAEWEQIINNYIKS